MHCFFFLEDALFSELVNWETNQYLLTGNVAGIGSWNIYLWEHRGSSMSLKPERQN